MKTLRKLLPAILLACLAEDAYPQLAPLTDQYILNPVLINPANAGARGALSVAAFYRKQWVGIKGAPETITLAADGLFSSGKVGVGFFVSSDKIGVRRENSLSTSYSYRMDVGASILSFGLKAGLISTKAKWSDLLVLDPGDEEYLVDTDNHILPDFSFGAHITDEKYFAGFSIPRLFQYDFRPEDNRYGIKANPSRYYYMFHGGYLFDVAPGLRLLPSALLSVSPDRKPLLDLNAHFIVSERVWAGVSYRTNNSMAGLFQFGLKDHFKIAYSYYLDFSRLGQFSNGSHEVMLRYEFLYRVDAVSPLIF